MPNDQPATLDVARRIDAACDRFEAEWRGGHGPRIEDYLAAAPDNERATLLEALLGVELELRHADGHQIDVDMLHSRFPDYRKPVEAACRSAEGASTITGGDSTVVPPAAIEPAPVPGYEILGELGRGAMGVVYRARQARPNRIVALKMILAGAHAGREAGARLLTEAELVARLQHPNIVQVYEVGSAADHPYLALEYVSGGTLANHLRGEPQPPESAARLVETLARAIHFAHTRGVVHRDLKPANILLVESREWSDQTTTLYSPLTTRQPKIADFGLARGDDSVLTMTGAVLGTPCYMAPEQAEGRKEVGPAADVYALGAILYECLTGRPPFRGATAVETIDQVRTREPVPVRALQPRVPRDLETIALKCLQKAPARRYATAEALADDLRRFLDGRPITARPVGPLERTVRWVRRRPTAAALIAVAAATAVAGIAASVAYDRRLADARAEELVRAVVSADTGDVPRLIDELRPYRRWANPRLADAVRQADPGSKERINSSLALFPSDPAGQVPLLADELLSAGPRELLIIRAALTPHADQLRDRYWSVLANERTDLAHWLRAAAALAAFAPDDARWAKLAPNVAGQLVGENPLALTHWIAAFRPVRVSLQDPLRSYFGDRGRAGGTGPPADNRTETALPLQAPDAEKLKTAYAAALILSDYLADQPDPLVELSLDADPRQLAALLPRLAPHRTPALARFRQALAEPIPPQREDHEFDREQDVRTPVARRHARAALGLLELGEPDGWATLRWTPDPMARTELIHLFAPARVDPERLLSRWIQELDLSVRRAILLALGGYESSALTPARRDRVVVELLQSFRTDPDPGHHAAVGWVLRQWGLIDEVRACERKLASREPSSDRRWYVNGQGQTMAVMPGPVTVAMGSRRGIEWNRGEDEDPHTRRISRSFAVSTTEVTQEQLIRFVKAVAGHPMLSHPKWGTRLPTVAKFSPDLNGPANHVSWYVAAMYCRWLSEQEGIPEDQMCYPPLSEFKYAMVMPPTHLSRTGYRLPTEAEWEYACRAGSTSVMSYGYDHDRLADYRNPQPRGVAVGKLKPNDLGMFDIYGNVAEWCGNRHIDWKMDIYQPKADGNLFEDVGVHFPGERVMFSLRGGSFAWAGHRSAQRRATTPDIFYGDFGFRIARTLPSPRPPWRLSFYHLDPKDGPRAPTEVEWAKLVAGPLVCEADVTELDLRAEGHWGARDFGLVAEAIFDLPAGPCDVDSGSDDGVRVFVDGKKVIDNWSPHSPAAADHSRVTLSPGRHAVRVEYYQRHEVARLHVWLTPGGTKE